MFDLEKVVRKNILELQPYSSARDEFKGKEGTFLDANENPFGTLNRYPDPYQKELKLKLSNLKEVNTNNIFIGNGSDEIIDLAYRIFCESGIDKALTFSPTYGMYNVSAAINNVALMKTPLNENFQIETGALKEYLKDENLKLIFICSPNNPTGNLIKTDDITFILNHFKGIVIVDEAYIDFAQNESLINLIEKYHNLIVSQTFSKAWALAGARVGIAYAHSKIITLYNKVKPPYNVSAINQQAAINALSNYASYNKNLNIILEEKKRMKTELAQISMVKKIYSSDANFWLIEVDNANELYEKLLHHKIITRNRSTQIKNCLRITIGTPNENNQLITALKNL